MDETIQPVEEREDTSWKITTYVIGGVLGALTGLGTAYLLTRNAEQKGTRLSISPTKGVKLGVLLAGLLRSIMNLGEE